MTRLRLASLVLGCTVLRRLRTAVAALGAVTTVASMLACSSAVLMPAMAAGAEPTCPNASFEGFEPYLADCGGYERVTPGFKDGARMPVAAISSDGSRIAGASLGVFGGDQGWSHLEAVYELVRSGAGWETSAVSPPISSFSPQEILDMNPNVGKSLWGVRSASQSVTAEELAVREPSGAIAIVGPIHPPTATEGPPAGEYQEFEDSPYDEYTGASSDLSHVFFSLRPSGPLWPGDTTIRNDNTLSLYEYVGTGNAQPILVGVNEHGELLSDCGIFLGSESGQGTGAGLSEDTYNAISTDGETVFFTAPSAETCSGSIHAPPVNEVYARVGHGEGAHTIPVSEPSVADCEACVTATKTRAAFQGASQDGSKVFFLTEQELFKEDTGMNLYEYDFRNPSGHRIVRVSEGSKTPEVQGVARVSEDGSHVYFVAKGVLTEGPNREGGKPVAGGENMYVFERDAAYPGGHLAFVATLAEKDARDWRGVDSRPVQATPDGRFVVFQSKADLTSGDTGTAPQVFEYDAVREEVARISIGEKGYAAGMESADTRGATIEPQQFTQGVSHASAPLQDLAVADDGLVVVFGSTGGLTRAAKATGEAELESVYEYRSSGVLSTGEVFSVSNGSGSFGAQMWGMGASGHDVIFQTQAPILPSDGDTQIDLYDARDGGGFPAPRVRNCEQQGLSCQGEAVIAPVAAGAGSAGAPGGGNLPESTAPPPPPRAPVVLSGAQRLAKALKACRKAHRPGRARRVCEAGARRRLGSAKTTGKG